MIQDAVKDRFDAARGLTSDDILSALGLARRRSTLEMLLPAAGIFVAGVAIGTGVALLWAPKSGQQMRRDIKEKANELSGRLGASASEMVDGVREALTHQTDEPSALKAAGENGAKSDRKLADAANRTPTVQK